MFVALRRDEWMLRAAREQGGRDSRTCRKDEWFIASVSYMVDETDEKE
jgi:hypothetical protein